MDKDYIQDMIDRTIVNEEFAAIIGDIIENLSERKSWTEEQLEELANLETTCCHCYEEKHYKARIIAIDRLLDWIDDSALLKYHI